LQNFREKFCNKEDHKQYPEDGDKSDYILFRIYKSNIINKAGKEDKYGNYKTDPAYPDDPSG